MLDDGMRSGVTPKLVGWDTKADKLHRVIYLPAPIAPKDAFVNDFTVDSLHNRIFIVDPAGGANAAFIVVDLETGAARRVLEGHQSVVPEKVDLIIDGRPIQVKSPWPSGPAAHRRRPGYRRFAERMGVFWSHAWIESLSHQGGRFGR